MKITTIIAAKTMIETVAKKKKDREKERTISTPTSIGKIDKDYFYFLIFIILFGALILGISSI